MANEITYDARLKVSKTYIDIERKFTSQKADMSGDAYSSGVQSIPTTAGGTALTIAAAVGTAGYALFRNLDSTNYVELGRQVGGSFYALIKLKPGEVSGPVRLATTAVYALANTAAVLLEHIIAED